VDLKETVYWIQVIAVVSLIYYQITKGSARSMILLIIMSLVVILETLTRQLICCDYQNLLNNLLVGLQMSFYMLFYLSLMKVGQRGKMMIMYARFYVLFWLVDSVFFHSIYGQEQLLVYVIGAGGVLLFILAYIHQDLMRSDRADIIFQRYFLWISGGLFIYLATEMPIRTVISYLNMNDLDVSADPIIVVKDIVSILYYSLYSIALLWVKTE
jgi:hypothetical protein